MFLDQVEHFGCTPNDRTFIVLLSALCVKMDFEKALDLFTVLINRGGKPDAICYEVMIRRFTEANRLNESEELFNQMIEKGFSPNLHVYNSLIDCFSRNRCLSKVSKFFNFMIKNGCTPDNNTHKAVDTAFPSSDHLTLFPIEV